MSRDTEDRKTKLRIPLILALLALTAPTITLTSISRQAGGAPIIKPENSGVRKSISRNSTSMREFMGINTSLGSYDSNLIGEIGHVFKWIREYHKWSHLEPTSNAYLWDSQTPSPYGGTWPNHQDFISECERHQIQVLVCVEQATTWASSDGTVTGMPVNTGNEERSVSIRAIDQDGHEIIGLHDYKIPAHLLLEGEASNLIWNEESMPVEFTRSLIVEADGPGIIGDVIFGDPDSHRFAAALPLSERLFQEAVFSHVANIPPFFTGLALFNAHALDTQVQIRVWDRFGKLTGETVLTLGAGKKRAGLSPTTALMFQIRPYSTITVPLRGVWR